MGSYEAIAIICATLLGPILAVQIQKTIERWTESKNRKRYIFYTLMSTRAMRLDPSHVAALNSIDLDFGERRYKKVVDAWRLYSDQLNQPGDLGEAQAVAWAERRDVLFFDLLFEMSQALGFSFDKVQLRRGVYYPRGFGDNEIAQRNMQEGALKVLSGEGAISMKIVDFPINQEAFALQKKLQQSLIDVAEGRGELHVTMKAKD